MGLYSTPGPSGMSVIVTTLLTAFLAHHPRETPFRSLIEAILGKRRETMAVAPAGGGG
jgi:hypothetical protein